MHAGVEGWGPWRRLALPTLHTLRSKDNLAHSQERRTSCRRRAYSPGRSIAYHCLSICRASFFITRNPQGLVHTSLGTHITWIKYLTLTCFQIVRHVVQPFCATNSSSPSSPIGSFEMLIQMGQMIGEQKLLSVISAVFKSPAVALGFSMQDSCHGVRRDPLRKFFKKGEHLGLQRMCLLAFSTHCVLALWDLAPIQTGSPSTSSIPLEKAPPISGNIYTRYKPGTWWTSCRKPH